MYARINEETRVVESQIGREPLEGIGPPVEPPQAEDGIAYRWLAQPIDWSAKPTGTSALHWFADEEAPRWVEMATLDELRAAKNAAINAWKLEANNTYFDFVGKRIAYTESDRVEIQGINNVVMLTGAMPAWADWPAAWKTMDNSWTPLPDVATWTAFNVAIGERGTAHFKRAQELKGELARATTPAEIEAIQW